MSIAAVVFFVLGIFFAIAGHIGLLNAPDVYTRLQTSSTCSTTSVISILIASMLLSGISPFTGKVAAISIFFVITSPLATHIIARYAWEQGIVPWRRQK